MPEASTYRGLAGRQGSAPYAPMTSSAAQGSAVQGSGSSSGNLAAGQRPAGAYTALAAGVACCLR